jgi:hypothetical protein
MHTADDTTNLPIRKPRLFTCLRLWRNCCTCCPCIPHLHTAPPVRVDRTVWQTDGNVHIDMSRQVGIHGSTELHRNRTTTLYYTCPTSPIDGVLHKLTILLPNMDLYPTLYDPSAWDSSLPYAYAYLPPPGPPATSTYTQQGTLYDLNAWDSPLPAMPYAYLPPLTPTQQHLEHIVAAEAPLDCSPPHASTPSAGPPLAKTSSRPAVSQRPTSSRYVPARHADRPKRSSGSTARPHHAVEKRYRSSLNDRFTALAELVAQPATQQLCQAQHCDGTDEEDKPASLQHVKPRASPGHKHSKTATLTQALQTIILLERACLRKSRQLNSRTDRLKSRLQLLPSRNYIRELQLASLRDIDGIHAT